MSIPLDYEILRLIWWLFLGVLLIGFAIMGGFDLGVAMLLPYVARNDSERRVTVNAIGRQSGMADPWRRRGVCRLAAGLRGVVLRILPGNVPGAGNVDPAPSRL